MTEARKAAKRRYYESHKEAIMARQRARRAEKANGTFERKALLTDEERARHKRESVARYHEKHKAEIEAKRKEKASKRNHQPERYAVIKAMAQEKRRRLEALPQCPVCGARQTNNKLVNVCLACGSKTKYERGIDDVD